ncbi:MAG: Holliday junction branch migration protein RuvA [Anaerolineaceae bacterium]|jgi:Holliday junction DNA helicase RuvA|nr:Holliday junction branch migration protein RuvA [Anaerolineaceae bacterium]HQJ32826.1 Holliday junction branch migration protein RuvA [Anaerolineaceae bacterium]
MIASISGKVIQLTKETVIMDINGLGFEVFVPKPLLSETEAGDLLYLYTYMLVREDNIALYGFTSLEEKQLFLQFLAVGGIGPKLSLSILSSLSIDNIRSAILSEKPDYFSRVPGIGKKTAQKIIIQMQGKLPDSDGLAIRSITDVDDAVVDALISLGYSVVEAQTALQTIPKNTPDDVETKLRVALQYFDHF